MDKLRTFELIVLLIGLGAVLLFLFSQLFKRQKARLRDEIERSGEALLAGPDSGLYQGGSSYVSLKTQGVMALTDRRLIFRKPIGGDIEIPLSQITGVSENTWFQGNYRSGKPWLILSLATGGDVAFMVGEHDHWFREIESRIRST